MMQKIVSPKKLQDVNEVKTLCEMYSTIGLAKLGKMSSSAMAALRAKLRGTIVIRVTKKTIMKRALEQVNGKPELMKLADRYTEKTGPSALIFTNLKAIKLRRLLDENRSKKRVKPGEQVNVDIVVPAGNTKLPPGPAVTELNQAGLPTRMQDGTIWIQKDTTVVKAGGVVDPKLALVLAKLNLEPVEVLLDLYSAWENGEVLDSNVLIVDTNKYKAMFQSAQVNAQKLAIESGYVTPENVRPILVKAYTRAKALAMKLPIIFPQFINEYLAKAQSEAAALDKAAKGKTN
jgi:large subunit ribosomal protein L10